MTLAGKTVARHEIQESDGHGAEHGASPHVLGLAGDGDGAQLVLGPGESTQTDEAQRHLRSAATGLAGRGQNLDVGVLRLPDEVDPTNFVTEIVLESSYRSRETRAAVPEFPAPLPSSATRRATASRHANRRVTWRSVLASDA